MNLEDPKIKAAFIRGYLNKQAEAGLSKEAFIAPLLTLLGGVAGQSLAGKYLTPKIVGFAEKQLAGRAAKASLNPGTTSRIGNAYDKFLNHLAKPVGPEGLTSRGAGAWAENIGFMGGGALGGAAGEGLEKEQPNPQEYQQYQA